jgi:hypothetical protein
VALARVAITEGFEAIRESARELIANFNLTADRSSRRN